MNLLTPSGYKNINDVNIGDELIAYDIVSGDIILNHLEQKYLWTHDMLPPIPEEGYFDENGDWIITQEAKTSEQVFDSIYGEWKFYKINNTWTLFHSQSVWENMNITNASLLQVGDIMYDGSNNDVIVTSIEEVNLTEWWRLEVSGDSSYISEDLTLHNASRYWVGGGSSTNWNATTNTNWSGLSGGANNASVPTSVDDVLFDVLGNTSSVISATITILSINISSGYTATMTHNAVLTIAGNVTLGANYTIAGTSGIVISAASTITSNGKTFPNSLTFQTPTSAIVTLLGNFTIGGAFIFNSYSFLNLTTAESLFVNGGLQGSQSIRGSATIVWQGGTWSSGGYINSNLTINGNVTFSGTTYYRGPTLKYLSGVVTTTANTLQLDGSTTFDCVGMSFNTINMDSGISITSLLTANKINVGGISGNFGGVAGFNVNFFDMVVTNANKGTFSFVGGVTYTINTQFTHCSNGFQVRSNFASSNASKVIFDLKQGAICNVIGNFNNFDASLGRSINTWNSIVINCINVNTYNDLRTISKSFV